MRIARASCALPLWLLLGSIGPLGFALFSQYILGLHPCHYCLLQRYPYGLPLVAGLVALLPASAPWRRGLLIAGMVGWAATFAIALRHAGIEQGWITEQGGCSAAALSGSVEAIRAQIMNAPLVACNEVGASFLGLSMAAWNAVCAAGLFLGGICLLRRKEVCDAR